MAGHLCHDNVTLIFDLLTPKPNQFTFVPKCTIDENPSVDTGNINSWMHGFTHESMDRGVPNT